MSDKIYYVNHSSNFTIISSICVVMKKTPKFQDRSHEFLEDKEDQDIDIENFIEKHQKYASIIIQKVYKGAFKQVIRKVTSFLKQNRHIRDLLHKRLMLVNSGTQYLLGFNSLKQEFGDINGQQVAFDVEKIFDKPLKISNKGCGSKPVRGLDKEPRAPIGKTAA